MARNIDPVCKMCRREGIKLYLKGSRCDSPKCALDRRKSAPGMHGAKRTKLSEYGVRLREKQKLKRFYGLLEAQFRRVFQIASRSTANTGEALLSLMERRLDNVVYRLGFCGSRRMARQFVTHGHVQVNGRAVNIPSFITRTGDVITVRNRAASRGMARHMLQQETGKPPDFLERVSVDPPEGRVLRLPERADVDPNIRDIREQLIIEISAR
ncbi:MAG TPA: 30S ribosomal protein S4 [Gemmatales bacterium]|nr:30S ribosomal protein S4 [Gemmatales bacterium]HMP58150.1 30S ribosomal protein S4 [Gemmatales bacterium]